MIGRTLTLSCNKNEAPYATILALNGGGFSAQKSVYIFMAWDFVYLSYYVLFLKWMYFFL
uniref:COesterase domain-containing protein n=1 Tax=Heterorhabditis bacteriophora TaxID=37862 RepID=A0A1I7WT36_HETBA